MGAWVKSRRIVEGLAVVGFLLSVGCSIKQEVTRADQKPGNVCIVEHDAVRHGVLEALKDGFATNGVGNRVIKGTYEKKHGLWHPTWAIADTSGCDAAVMYVANWSWDLALYMYFANIWMTTPDGARTLAQATYDASRGGGRPDKFINSREKILELVDEMMRGAQ